MTAPREARESPVVQGKDEVVVYTLTTTPWGSDPGGVVVEVYDITEGDYEDVTTSLLNGSVSVDGDVITLPQIKSLSVGHLYRVEILFEIGANTFECFFVIEAER